MIHVDRSISNALHSRRREIFNNGFRQSFHLMTVLEGEVARHYVSKILSSTCQRWLLVATGALVKTGPCTRSHIWMQISWPALIKRRGSIDRDKTPRYVSGQLLLHAMFDSHHKITALYATNDLVRILIERYRGEKGKRLRFAALIAR